jgi:hypothetical protein
MALNVKFFIILYCIFTSFSSTFKFDFKHVSLICKNYYWACRYEQLAASEEGCLEGRQLEQALQSLPSEHENTSEEKLRYMKYMQF